MNQRISDFTTKTSLSDDSFIPTIDKNGGGYENYKVKISQYFCTKKQYDELFKKVNDLDNFISENNTFIDNNIANLNENINKIVQEKIDKLNADLSAEINKKQNKNVGVANRVIISDNNKTIAVSDITKEQLYYLNGLTENIQTQIDRLKNNLNSSNNTIQDNRSDIDHLLQLINKPIKYPNYFNKTSIDYEKTGNSHTTSAYTTSAGGWLKAWGRTIDGGNTTSSVTLFILDNNEWKEAYHYFEYTYGAPCLFLPIAPGTTFKVVFGSGIPFVQECSFYSFA